MMSARAHHLNPDGTAPAHLASAGRPTPWVQVRIVGDKLQELPIGEIGEIYVRSESTMSGYWNKPAETATTVHDGWVLTGDIGRLDEDGYLYIVDRKKDMVVTGGYNVYPSEIENAISTIAEVAEVAVVGAPTSSGARRSRPLSSCVRARPAASKRSSTPVPDAWPPIRSHD
jgi:long-chain acyl-CoA synthetase